MRIPDLAAKAASEICGPNAAIGGVDEIKGVW